MTLHPLLTEFAACSRSPLGTAQAAGTCIAAVPNCVADQAPSASPAGRIAVDLEPRLAAPRRIRVGAVTSRDVNTPAEHMINQDDIAQAERLIRPHVRRTPVFEADAADFGLAAARLSFKLELFQHAGSFKTRGAFTNLLTRNIPRAGVVAASGGNHGAAVAYASLKLGIPAKVFVPTISSPAKIQRIRGYRAELVVTGDRYADALAASEIWAAQSGAPLNKSRTRVCAPKPTEMPTTPALARSGAMLSPRVDSALISVTAPMTSRPTARSNGCTVRARLCTPPSSRLNLTARPVSNSR